MKIPKYLAAAAALSVALAATGVSASAQTTTTTTPTTTTPTTTTPTTTTPTTTTSVTIAPTSSTTTPTTTAPVPANLGPDQLVLSGTCIPASTIVQTAEDAMALYVAFGPPAGVYVDGNWVPAAYLAGTASGNYVVGPAACLNPVLPPPVVTTTTASTTTTAP
ncbi:MAG: hypothetical protein ACLQVK_10435 [Acidimicrobiales bacterium]